MPPTAVHFNGSINLPDPETVFRELAASVGELAHAYPDGEPGDRNNWIFYQFPILRAVEGIVDAAPRKMLNRKVDGGDEVPQLGLAEGVAADDIDFGKIGYADAYKSSYEVFRRLRDGGVIPQGVRFQVEYPTPTAVVRIIFRPEDQEQVLPAYERAMFRDLATLLEAVPHQDIDVQWDVAAEFGILEDADWYNLGPDRDRDAVVPALGRCVDAVPSDVPVGLHLCYGDYKHQHESEPESLQLQVDVANGTVEHSKRSVDFVAFTVPQYRDDEAYFAPLGQLTPHIGRRYFGIVPYRPAEQAEGTTARQAELIDTYVTDWGVCTECGMGRIESDDTSQAMDVHRRLVQRVR